MKFIFLKDYININGTRNFKKGVICNVLNDLVVIKDDGEFLFDVNSNLARRFGKIID